MNQELTAEEFDEQALAELREDLGDSFAGFIEQFMTSARAALVEIDEAVQRGDYHGAIAPAHSLRGIAGYVGAVAMGNALGALQQAAQLDEGRDDVLRHAATARDAFIKIQARLLETP